MKNKIIDLFCGCGGLSLGFEQAGFEPALAIDFWEDAIKTYNFNRKKKTGVCGDICSLTDKQLLEYKGNVVGVIGGPPCQGFSTVGKRQTDDPRNQLYKQYCRIVEIVDPDFFVLENVKGLLTLSGGFFKEDIVKRFSALGYKVTYKVLNAANYGVPQNRERVFFVGIKNKEFVFPKEFKYKLSASDGISDLEYGKYKKPVNDYQKIMHLKNGKIENHELTKHSADTIRIIGMVPDGGNIKSLPPEYWNIRKYNKAFERMSSSRPSNTVDTGHRNYFHYKENRIPTVRENARLQSFPDSFVFCCSRTSQYKQVGNAVPPLLAYAIAKALAEQLEE